MSDLMYMVLLNRQIFCDFGGNFRIVDATGEQPTSVLISHISCVSSRGGEGSFWCYHNYPLTIVVVYRVRWDDCFWSVGVGLADLCVEVGLEGCPF